MCPTSVCGVAQYWRLPCTSGTEVAVACFPGPRLVFLRDWWGCKKLKIPGPHFFFALFRGALGPFLSLTRSLCLVCCDWGLPLLWVCFAVCFLSSCESSFVSLQPFVRGRGSTFCALGPLTGAAARMQFPRFAKISLSLRRPGTVQAQGEVLMGAFHVDLYGSR